MTNSSDSKPTSNLQTQLGGLRTSVRQSLKITRRLQQGEPVYIVHDPNTFASVTLDADDYLILGAIGPHATLQEICDGLIQSNRLGKDQAEDFFHFILSLKRQGLLGHQAADGNELFQQSIQQKAAAKRGGIMRWLMPKIPLVNPDQFLENTLPLVGWLFSKTFLILWCLLVVFSGYLLIQTWGTISSQSSGVLASSNLPFLCIAFVVTKIWHELGHGYACKRYGGGVPEMGTLLMMGMPLAYVDASAAWSFEKRRHRLAVMLGGMYFESLIGIASLFVLAFADNPFLTSCAVQLLLMTSVTTVLFNANPLMRYDGYFILCECVEVPNLRSEAAQRLSRFLKKATLGVDPATTSVDSFRKWFFFLIFAIASLIYTTMLSIGIAAMIAQSIPLVGALIALVYLFSSYWPRLRVFAAYLRSSPELQHHRGRARAIGFLCFFVLPASFLLAPTPFHIKASGVLSAEQIHITRASAPGYLQSWDVRPQDVVSSDQVLGTLVNSQIEHDLRIAIAESKMSSLNRDVAREEGPEALAVAEEQLHRDQYQVDHVLKQKNDLVLKASRPGVVVSTPLCDRVGQFVAAGESLMTQTCGSPRLRTYLQESDMLHAVVHRGAAVRFTIAGQSGRSFEGVIEDVSLVSQRDVNERSLSHLAGGSLLIDPTSGRPSDTLFAVTIDPKQHDLSRAHEQGRVWIILQRRYEPLGWYCYRKITEFVVQLQMLS